MVDPESPTFDSSSDHVPKADGTTEHEMHSPTAGVEIKCYIQPMPLELNKSGALYGEAAPMPPMSLEPELNKSGALYGEAAPMPPMSLEPELDNSGALYGEAAEA